MPIVHQRTIVINKTYIKLHRDQGNMVRSISLQTQWKPDTNIDFCARSWLANFESFLNENK